MITDLLIKMILKRVCHCSQQVYPKVADGPTLPEGSFITCGSDDTIRIWNINQSMGGDTAYRRNIYSSVNKKSRYGKLEITEVALKMY